MTAQVGIPFDSNPHRMLSGTECLFPCLSFGKMILSFAGAFFEREW
jgi:hypothetical protein